MSKSDNTSFKATQLNSYSGCNSTIPIDSCTASSEKGGKKCTNAFDGNEDNKHDWASNKEGAGAWIQLQFQKTYHIKKVGLKHRAYSQCGNFKDISLMLSNGDKILSQLNNDKSSWNFVEFPPNLPATNRLKVTAVTVYKTASNGFAEIIVYGCKGGN